MCRLHIFTMVLVFATAAADAANSEDLHFPVEHYAVQGASVFTPQQIGALLAPYTGPAISFSDIEAARAALQAAYLRAGWGAALVTIPEQEVAGASIRLQVLEPRLKSIDLSGNQRFDRANVLASLPALRLGSMPNTAELAGQVALANENPAKQTEVVFRSAGEPGQIEAAVQVAEDRLWRRFVSLDNSGTEETGEYRLAAGAQYANLWNRDHVVTLQYTTSPSAPARVHIFGAGYRIPLYATGDSVELVAGYSSVDSGTVQGLFDVSGNGRLFGARYIHKPARAGDYAQQISAGFDWRDFTSNVGFNGQPLGNRVLTHPLSVAYGGSWRRNAIESGFTATLAHNLPGGRYGREEHFRKARAEAPAAFTVLRVNAHAGVELPRNWQLRMDFQAQYSADPLVSGEQFGLGGADSIRGLRERALAGDKGYKLSADLLTPALPATQDMRLRGLVFYDCGRLGRNAAQPGEPERQGVASAGLGLRLDYSSYLRLRLDWAHILKGSGDTSDAVARAGDERIHASLLVNF